MTAGLDWDDLRVFLAIHREGSFSAAARRLRVSQPTVSRRLQSLEQVLAARLFDRRSDGLEPTPAGAELLPLAEAMERSADAVARRQASFAETASGTVRLSLYENVAQFVTALLPDLRARLPAIEIELAVAHLAANLSRREADLLLRECRPETPGLIARKLGEMAYAVYGARTLVESLPAAWSEARYADCPWVGVDEEHRYFPGQSWLAQRLQGRLPAVRTNNGIVLHDAVRRGVGLGILPCFAGDADPALRRVTPPLAEAQPPIHLLVHRDLRRSPAVRAVMDALVEAFQARRAALLGLPAAVPAPRLALPTA